MKEKKSLLFYLLIFVIIACNRVKLDVDTSKISMPIQFTNLDSLEYASKDVSVLKKTILESDLRKDEILSYQFNYCLGVGNLDDSSFHNLVLFTEDPYFLRVHQVIEKQLYPSLKGFNQEMIEGFKRLKAHQVTDKFPSQIIYMNSAFSSSVFSTENEIGISLERYLLDTNAVINELPSDPFYGWLRAKFDSKYLVRDALMGWITTHIVDVTKGDLSEKMIQYGKALLLTKAALLEKEDEFILRYSHDQYKWARENEKNIWGFLVNEKLLYTSNERDHTNLLNDGPYTPGLPEAGPDRLGQFTGYQMVWNYLRNHPKVTLKELINLPYTTIVKEYKID